MDELLASLLVRKLYGLQPANVLVLPIPRFCGYRADPTTSLSLDADWHSAHRSAGSGFAMLSCGWTHYAFWCAHGIGASAG